MSAILLAKSASELKSTRQRVRELEEKLAHFEKRAAAEDFLVNLMQDPHTPLAVKPSSVNDFFEKRAAVERLDDIKVAELAVKMASSTGFEIGSPEDSTPLFQSSGSKADDDFIEYLLGSQG